MKENYVTLVYLSEDEENANYLAEILEEQKHVEVHSFEKGEAFEKDILKDISNSCGLIILHISDDFDYNDYQTEIKKAHGKCQIITCYTSKAAYQCNYPINEIELVDGYPIEALANDICIIVVGGFNKVKIHWYNRKKYRKIAFKLFNEEKYAWSLCLLLKLFKISDMEVKERIADAYANLMDNDRAINYYSICMPLDLAESNNTKYDDETQGIICNNLGYLYTQTKNLEFAERYLKKAIQLKNPDALYNLGYLYESCWSFDSTKRRTKEGYDIYCKVLKESYTSESSKERAKDKLKKAAERLLLRKNYAAALQYFKAIGDGAKAAECIRNIKRIRQLYEERKKRAGISQPKKTVSQAEVEKAKASTVKISKPKVVESEDTKTSTKDITSTTKTEE